MKYKNNLIKKPHHFDFPGEYYDHFNKVKHLLNIFSGIFLNGIMNNEGKQNDILLVGDEIFLKLCHFA